MNVKSARLLQSLADLDLKPINVTIIRKSSTSWLICFIAELDEKNDTTPIFESVINLLVLLLERKQSI